MIKAKMATISCCALLALAACASPEELRLQDANTCHSYGFVPNTPEFAACMQRESLARSEGSGLYPSVGLGFGGFGFGGGDFGGAGIGLGMGF